MKILHIHDSNNWISLPFSSLWVFLFRLIVKGRIIRYNFRDKKISVSTLEINSLLIPALWIAQKKLILIIDIYALLLRERISHRKFGGIKVIEQFCSCLETATRICPLKQLFFWSWINHWNYVWACMLMLNLIIKN